MEEILKNAEEALNLHIEGEPDIGRTLPQPSQASGENIYLIDVRFQVAIAILLK